MTDFMTPEDRSAHMAKIRSKDTKPELALRSLLHRAGYRYKLHDKSLPGKPDIVFPSRKKVIFVNGCFWHGHDCPVGVRLPKSNTEFWRDKRERNHLRDVEQKSHLEAKGWKAMVVWECQVKSGDDYLGAVKNFLA
ncbi:very short patch repair endonuclease [Paenarthrobacter sp. FR1]|uniref:very short patch repair endonuclease n=1 Tax=Paenarthrobacter sp. FR1 TaxID=3439548 RepID=UPI003DA2D0C7